MGRIGVATAIQDAATAIGSVRFAVLGIAAALMLLIFTKVSIYYQYTAKKKAYNKHR